MAISRSRRRSNGLGIVLVWTIFISAVWGWTPPLRGSSRLFLDSADPNVWNEILPTGMFYGITTNPTLLERSNQPCTVANLQRLANLALRPPTPDGFAVEEFMCQAWGETVEELYTVGMQLTDDQRVVDQDRIVVKVPVTFYGTQAAAKLIRAGRRVCLTACYDPSQVLIAANLGADYLAPYVGRMDDTGRNGAAEVSAMLEVVDGLQADTRILVASVRDVLVWKELAAEGCDTFTVAPEVVAQLFREPLTDEAAAVFQAAAWRNAR